MAKGRQSGQSAIPADPHVHSRQYQQLQPQTQHMHNRNISQQFSDMEADSDYPYIYDALPNPAQEATPLPTRTNEELNLSVLQRHHPQVRNVLSIAPYAVVYNFSPSVGKWEKKGVEGTMFVCRFSDDADWAGVIDENGMDLEGERYGIIVLNRMGLQNFELELRRTENVDVQEEIIVLTDKRRQEDTQMSNEAQAEGKEEEHVENIYGLWIFAEAEPMSTAKIRIINTKVIQDCATRAEASQRDLEYRRARWMAQSQFYSTQQRNFGSTGEWFVDYNSTQSITNGFAGSYQNDAASFRNRQPVSNSNVLEDLFHRARVRHTSNV